MLKNIQEKELKWPNRQPGKIPMFSFVGELNL